ncbi:hypothetical protein D6777_02340 [Candidatus Woesearchaeota archaeon]|nr:MAG: hypothetical protein D6777_02340 [Candidatus Woesearchaeota archaeon]
MNEYLIKISDEIEKECKAIEAGKKVNKTFLKNAIDTIKMFHGDVNKNVNCNMSSKELYEDKNNNYVSCVEEALEGNNKDKIVETAWRYAQYVKEKLAR